MKRFLAGMACAAMALVSVGLWGCGGGGGRGPDIVCTTGMVADVVRAVVGNRYTVGQLMGAGVDPHLYESTPGDAKQLDEARLIFYSGLHLEGKMADLFKSMARRKPTYALAEGIPEDRLLKNNEGRPDPHVWFDVALWAHTVEVVEKAMVEFDPAHADEYRANAKVYRDKLAALDTETRETLKKVPAKQRVLVTAHDAFEYFGRAYDIKVRAIQGISTESEAAQKTISDLVRFLTQNRIKAVFVESSVPRKNMEAIVEGCASAGHKVVIGGELFSDAMGNAGTPEGTYVGMVRHNVHTIVRALQ
jgi:manganese/zinc/iron transport system substrate-binding protein